MNTHPVEPEIVMAYHDGQLSEAEAVEVQVHLEQCADCRSLVSDLEKVSTNMKEWTVVPAGLVVPEMPSRWWSSPLALKVGIVCAGLIAVAFIVFYTPLPSAPEKSAKLMSAYVAPAPAPMAAPRSTARMSDEVEPRIRNAPIERKQERPTGPFIIRTATLALVAKDFLTVRESLERIVSAHHGFVKQLETAGHVGAARSLASTVAIPSQDMAAVLVEFRALGTVEQETQGGEEVTQQHSDLVARLANARNTEKRLTEVLATRTGKLSDVLEVEQEMARVREEIESLDSELRSMDKRIQYATITLRVSEEFKAEIINHAPSISTRLWNASVDGIESTRNLAIGLTELMLRSFPVLAFLALLLFLPARWLWRTAREHGHLQ